MEFVLLMCVPVVIMTQMPSFQDDGLPFIVAFALSAIIIFPVILVGFFLVRLMRGIMKEVANILKSMTSNRNLDIDGDDGMPKSKSWGGGSSEKQVRPNGPLRASTVPFGGDELAMADGNRSALAVQSDTEYERDAMAKLEGAGTTTNGTNGLLGTTGAHGEMMDTVEIEMEDMAAVMAEIDRLSIDLDYDD